MKTNTSMFTCSSKKYKVAFIGSTFLTLKSHMERLIPKGVVRDILSGKNTEWVVHTGKRVVH